MTMPNMFKKQIIIWLFSCLCVTFLIVIVGGSVRLTGSGLSMINWKPITKILPPLNEQEWSQQFHQYQQFPEYKKVNYSMTLAEYKSIYWWEYIHRILGRFLGLLFLIPFIIFKWQKKIEKTLQKKLFIIFLLGGLQGVLGWLMVKSGLSGKPHVSHYLLAMHLVLAYLIFCSILWIILSLCISGETLLKQRRNKVAFCLNQWLLFFLIIQVIYGAFAAGLKAGYIYNTFPLMGSSFFPNFAFGLQPLWINFFDNKGLVQFIHRNLGYLIFLLGSLFTYQMRNCSSEQRLFINISFILLFLQVILGITILILAVPISLGVMHQGIALLLLSSYLICLHQQMFDSKWASLNYLKQK